MNRPIASRDWHALPAAEALASRDSDQFGLEETEASRRLAEVGPNTLPEPRTAGVLWIFLRQFTSPLIYLLLGAGLLSLIIGDRWDAVFIFGVLLANAAITTFQEKKADDSARALRSLVPRTARLRRSGIACEVPSAEIVPGDIVELESGMQVTADIRLLETLGLQIDEAALTGESLPVVKDSEAVLEHDTPVGDRSNMAFAGTTVMAGRGLGVTVETAQDTQLGRIGRTLEEAAHLGIDTPLVRRLGRLARQIAIGSVALIMVLSVILFLQGESWREIVLLAIALAVAAIPEGLPVAVTVALAVASRRMAKRNVIVRELPAVEGLGACTLIATDKTGTLTVNHLTVERVVLPDGSTYDGNNWRSGSEIAPLHELGRAMALCNEARLTETGSPVGDAVDRALLYFARETGHELADLVDAERLAVVPYEPELRFAAVEAEYEGTIRIIVKGAPETVLPMCAGNTGRLEEIVEQMADDGYRVLLLAESESDGSGAHIRNRLQGLKPLGLVGLTDPLRAGAAEAVARCRDAGIGVRMITGDHPATAQAISREIGLPTGEGSVVTGEELAELAEMPELLNSRIRDASVFARIEPAQKLAIVRTLSEQGNIVAVTGDGVNDGPALRAADIGVAMGMQGTDVAREAADLILADDNFATIVAGIQEGRITFNNIRKIVLFMLATGIAEIAMFLGALMAGLPMPLTPVQLLWLNLVTNGVQDVTLGFGRGEGDELQRPPRRRLASLIDREALILMLPGALVMTGMAIWLLEKQLGAGASLEEARNGVLLMVVLFQNAFLLSVRHLRRPFWYWHRPENGWMFAGMGAALALHVGAMHLPVTQLLLGVEPVGLELLGQCLIAAVAVLIVTEGAKTLVRKGRASSLLRSGLGTGFV